MTTTTRGRVLVTGATGYVGSRLVPRLIAAGWRVRAFGRSLAKLRARPWAADPAVELAEGDVTDAAGLDRALEGCSAAYYLVHAMGAAGAFEEADAAGARAFAAAARRAGVARIVYLGGLGDAKASSLSPHLRSRQEVGRLLATEGVPVTELRAGVILGSGSASFEILRYLVDRLPVMITPRWVSTPAQPIAIRDVLAHLVDCLDEPRTAGRVLEIGGPEVMTYRHLMEIYAEEAGLRRRLVVPVPVLTPRLSSYWIHLVTPAPASLARPLAEGLRNPVVIRDGAARELLPRTLLTPREAIRSALDPAQREAPERRWTDATGRAPAAWGYAGDARWTGGTALRDAREVHVEAAPPDAWTAIARLAAPRVWRVGDAEPRHRMRLVSEKDVHGRRLLDFEVAPEGSGSRVRQVATFLPRGLAGLVSWRALLPLRRLALRRTLASVAREARALAAGRAGESSSASQPIRAPTR